MKSVYDCECEIAGVILRVVTPWWNWRIMFEDRTCTIVEYMLGQCLRYYLM